MSESENHSVSLGTLPGAPTGGEAAPLRMTQMVEARAARRARWRRVAADRSQDLSKWSKFGYGAAGIVLVVALWQVLAAEHVLNELIFSSPWDVLQAARSLFDDGTLGTVVGQSAQLFGVAFGLALVIGIAGGIVIGWYRRIGAIVDPLVSIAYAAPRVALIPVITVWVGIGFEAQVITVLLTAVFPIMINVQAGVSSTDRNLVQVARGYLGTNFDVLRTVALPGAVPHIISGVRQGLAQALIGVVVAEYLIGSLGIGGLIVSAGQSLDSADAFVGVLIMSFAALVLTMGLRRLERRLDHWRH
jgi:ABC-type nitrate/sulfonate/bicarbonate transport system permease component